uniref:Pentatricopeptide repeat-containing protein n=1 Tax=Leersia perrieri TaxID=77586 RepID=A0A0D9V4Y2_9ORYZ
METRWTLHASCLAECHGGTVPCGAPYDRWVLGVCAHGETGRSRKFLRLIDEMHNDGATVREATLASVLTPCAQLGALERGTL